MAALLPCHLIPCDACPMTRVLWPGHFTRLHMRARRGQAPAPLCSSANAPGGHPTAIPRKLQRNTARTACASYNSNRPRVKSVRWSRSVR